MAAETPGADAITLQIAYQRLSAIPEVVDQNITKTAFSPLVADYKDYAVGIVDAQGRLITQARGGLPIFVANALGTAVRHGLEIYGADNLHTGDIVISNHPGTLGQHLNNVVMYTPIHTAPASAPGEPGALSSAPGEPPALFGFFAIVVHLLDVGGGVIGSIAPHSRDIWQEGIQYPTVKLWNRGERAEDVYRILEANTRFPKEVRGDVAAQVAGCLYGRDRVAEVIGQYGAPTVEAAIARAWDQSKAHVRQQVTRLRPGVYSATSQLDDDGVHLGRPIDVRVEVTVDRDGAGIAVDFSGVADEVPSAHNAGFNGGAVAAARLAVKYLFAPNGPANEGDFAALRVTARPGTFLSATEGTALGCSGNILPTVVDTILRALADAGADVPAAHHGNYSWHIFGGRDPRTGQLWQSMSSMAGGWGAADDRDGSGPFRSVCHGDTLEVPVELQEALFPIRVEEMAIRVDSGGPGRRRGGPGMTKTVRLLSDATLSASMDRVHCPPWGLHDGGAGRSGGGTAVVDGVSAPFLKVSAMPLPAGSVVTVASSGGGGFGDPLSRPAEEVASDVQRELVSPEQASAVYGVHFDADGAVDENATTAARTRLTADRIA